MKYTFKEYSFSEAELTYLRGVAQKKYSHYETNTLKVELWDKLSDEFSLENLKKFAIWYTQPTLLGLWYVNKNHYMLKLASDVIEQIKKLILSKPGIKAINSDQISSALDSDKWEIEIILKLICDIGFFSSCTCSNNRFGCREVKFSDDDSAYDRFLNYQKLDDELEKFYIDHPPVSIKTPKFSSKSKMISNKNSKNDLINKAWKEIEQEYGISKNSFGKKINFIKNAYKRQIVFRDIAFSYTLAKQDFSKSAIILAGGVIEELLRLYLIHKNLKPKSNTFNDYIKTCDNNNLLRSGVSRLSDSVRHFRNLVHLEKEKSKKHAMSKSTAIGSVSSIFSIVNEFE